MTFLKEKQEAKRNFICPPQTKLKMKTGCYRNQDGELEHPVPFYQLEANGPWHTESQIMVILLRQKANANRKPAPDAHLESAYEDRVTGGYDD